MAEPRSSFMALRNDRRPWGSKIRPDPKRWVARPFPREPLWHPWSPIYELASPSRWWKDAMARRSIDG